MLSQAERERTERLADSYILQTHPADHAAWIADVDMTPEVGARAKWVTVGVRLASVQKKALLGGAHVLKMQDDGSELKLNLMSLADERAARLEARVGQFTKARETRRKRRKKERKNKTSVGVRDEKENAKDEVLKLEARPAAETQTQKRLVL